MKAEQRVGDERRRDIRLERERLRTVIERIADGILVVNNDGLIKFANPAAQELLGRSAEELTDLEIGFPVVSGDKAEVQLLRGDQPPLTAELRVVETDWAGEPAHLVSLRDVSDRKRAEERSAQLERERIARAKAEAANQAKSDFLTLMSHELRTPLNAVLGYADLLDLGIGGPLAPAHQQHVTRIRQSGRHLLGLVNELLDLAKVESGALTIHMGLGDGQVTIMEGLALVRPAADARNVELVTKPSHGSQRYEGDPARVLQIVVNLLSNAVKFTEPGGRVTIESGMIETGKDGPRRRGTGPWFYIRVTDTGIGIAPEKLDRIFDPFVQVEEAHTRTKEGAGLGLTISRRLARLMHGELDVSSETGKGSVFTLWLCAPGSSSSTERRADARAEEFDEAVRRTIGLSEIAEILIRETGTIMARFVERLRTEQIAADATDTSSVDLSDHTATFLTNVASLLAAVAAGRTRATTLLADAAHIQTTIAERHGTQRAQLGWTTAALRREWMILCEEIEAAVARHSGNLPEAAIPQTFAIIERLIEQAIETSCRAISRANPDDGSSNS